jgi:hypothetical protein
MGSLLTAGCRSSGYHLDVKIRTMTTGPAGVGGVMGLHTDRHGILDIGNPKPGYGSWNEQWDLG